MGREENEAKKKYLWGYDKARRQQMRIEEELEMIRGERILPGINIDGMPHGSRAKNDLSEYIVKIDAIMIKLIKAKEKKIEARERIMESIEELQSENEKDVLKARYIDLMSWEEICKKMNYQWAQVHRFHARALRNINIKHDTQ